MYSETSAVSKDDWGTPDWLFGWFNRRYQFDCDAASTVNNALAPRIADGLKDDWGRMAWCNPPYGRGVTGIWVRRAYEQTRENRCAVQLVPCRTSESWWALANLATIRFEILGRVKFVGAGAGAKFPSAVLVFTPWTDGPPLVRSLDRDEMIREHEEVTK